MGRNADDPLLGVVFHAVCRGEETYLLDSQLCHIVATGPGGESLRTMGREGEGPGEFRQPSDLIGLDDNTLMVVQSYGPPVYLDRMGDPVEAPAAVPTWDPGAGGQLGRILPFGDGLVVAERSFEFPAGKMTATLRIELRSKEGPPRELRVEERNLSIPHGPLRERVWEETEDYLEPSTDGSRLFAAWSFDEYVVEVLDRTGRVVGRIERA